MNDLGGQMNVYNYHHGILDFLRIYPRVPSGENKGDVDLSLLRGYVCFLLNHANDGKVTASLSPIFRLEGGTWVRYEEWCKVEWSTRDYYVLELEDGRMLVTRRASAYPIIVLYPHWWSGHDIDKILERCAPPPEPPVEKGITDRRSIL